MQQVDLQSPHGQNFTQRRALWFVSFLLVLLVASAIGGTYFVLRTARENIPVTLEYDLGAPIQHRAATLTGWYAKLQDQVIRLASMDMVRLFANEVNDLTDREISTMLAREREEQTSPGDADAVSRLASQIPLMRRSLQNLIMQSDIVAATLVTRSMHPYLSTAEPAPNASTALPSLTPDVQQALQSCLRDGKAVFLPIQATPQKHLHGMLVRPLFAPEYLARPGNEAVGAIILTCNVTHLVNDMTTEGVNQQSWLFQKGKSGLQQLLPNGTISTPFPRWETNASGSLPIGLRAFPGIGNVYALGMLPPDLDLPLLIAETIRAESVEATYEAHKLRVIFVTSASTLIAMLFIGMFWWWIVGHRERAVSNTLQQLYQAVNEQHALLNSINASLADGIILHDKRGVIGYVNDAFAAMVDAKPENLTGRVITAVLPRQLTDSFFRHMEQAAKSNKPELYEEVLTLKEDDARNYHVSCAPFLNADGNVNGVVSVYSDVTDLLRAQKQAQIVLGQTISALVRAIEAIDPYLGGQSMQTGTLASYLVQGLRLEEVHDRTIRLAANLSQLGMIQVPRHLVNKAGALTNEERAELQKHVEYTRATLEGIDFGLPVVEAIYEMHELLDGSGYPRHLSGDEIGIHGRILAVANTFCALVCPRSYRQAHAVENALAILSTAPPKYDPQIVAVLCEFLQTPDGVTFLDSLTSREKE